jgi:hypothetical protein
LSNWRPITLLCTDYKILSKIFTIRLKRTLPDIISEEQTGGVAERKITQNLVSYRNIIEHYSSQKPAYPETTKVTQQPNSSQNLAIVSLDFEKAYDRLDRTFLYEVLNKLGYNKNFIQVIKTLYENTVAKVLVNGVLSNEIKLGRGVRQGCPLAMYLYIIFLEPLLRQLKNVLPEIKISRANYVLTAYVDDVAIFIKNLEDFLRLGVILENFQRATNSKINKEKTQTLLLGGWRETVNFFGKINHENKNTNWAEPSKSVKILGITWFVDIETTIKENCQDILRKSKGMLHNSLNRFLSIHQKVSYFNTFISPHFGYFAKILPVPELYTKDLQRSGFSYLWKGKIETLSQLEIYNPEREGGLNIINVDVKCKSLLIKNTLIDIFNPTPNPNQEAIFYWAGMVLRNFRINRDPERKHHHNSWKRL